MKRDEQSIVCLSFLYKILKIVHTSYKSKGDSMKKTILFLCIVIIFFIIIISFFILNSIIKKEDYDYYKKISNKENIENVTEKSNLSDNSHIIVTSYSGFKVSPNTKIIFETFYNKCNHKEVKEVIAPIEIVNLNQEELEAKYKDYTIKRFSVENVILYKEIDSYCENHFVLKESEGVIAIYKINNLGEEELMDLTDVSVQYLSETDKLNLQDGIKIYGIENLDKALEDFE